MTSRILVTLLATTMACGAVAPAFAQASAYQRNLERYDAQRTDYYESVAEYQQRQAAYERDRARYERARSDYDRRYPDDANRFGAPYAGGYSIDTSGNTNTGPDCRPGR